MQNEHITSPTAAIKIILGGNNPASFKTKEVLTKLAEEFPHIETHYRFVFGTLKRLAKSYEKFEATGITSLETIAATIRSTANANYETSGWDVIAECWSVSDIMNEMMRTDNTTEARALKHFKALAKSAGEERNAQLAEVF